MLSLVYVFREGPQDSIELRYSLRSLINLKYDKIYIVGELPKRIQNVEHIPATDKSKSRYENVINKLKLICEDKRISEDFILMNDDFYILRPIEDIPYYTKGTLRNHMQYILDRHGITKYYDIIQKVYELYPDGMSFNVHCPIIYNKKKLKKLLKKYGDEEISIRSLYCNMYEVEYKDFGEKNINDCKVFANTEMQYSNDFLSSNDDAMKNQKFKEFLSFKFPNKSTYEKNFLSFTQHTMLFRAKPKYAVSLSKLVTFDSQGNFQTDDLKLIDELKRLETVKLVSDDEVATPTKTEEVEAPKELDIAKLREQYKEKFNKKCYGGRTAEQILEKLQ